MKTILFDSFGKEKEADGKSSLLELARAAGIPLTSDCGGRKTCGKCRIRLETVEGRIPEPTERETEILGDLTRKGYRLACETILDGGARVHIPEESRTGRQIILTSSTSYNYLGRLNPALKPFRVEVPPPVLGRVTADKERLLSALSAGYGIKNPAIDSQALKDLPNSLRSGARGVDVILFQRKEIIHVRPAGKGGFFGVAFDMGTTTVAACLIDLVSGRKIAVTAAMNPQIHFGEDILTRIHFCNKGKDHLGLLQSRMMVCMNDLIRDAAQVAGIDATHILEAAVVGNTAMHHLFAGVIPKYLAEAPYTPVFQKGEYMKARDLKLEISPSAYVYLLPVKAGFVGSDAIACALATRIHRRKPATLLIDLGTNGEILFGNNKGVICCSTAAGPAFEGGHIRFGMRAAAGAIDRVRIDPVTYEVRFRTILEKRALGICGSGIISAAAEMVRTGIILANGRFNDAIKTPRLRPGQDGNEFVLVWKSEADLKEDIVLSGKDLSELQMAKAALHAGAQLIMEKAGMVKPDLILLAGAGGNYVEPLDACAIDLIPGCSTTSVIGIGNAALHGACLALMDKNQRREAERIASHMEYVELSGLSRFQDLFVSSLFYSQARDR
ncbi:MAG TPA: DUF4445 domain-containing protein [Deltaproteobacteria bacterium]|nr:DUF4445 domain-containing protein [Deltaproteobacteria bacterium]